MHFCWTTVSVRDMDESLRFYREILELPLNTRMNPAPGLELAFLGSGETQVELICSQEKNETGFSENISLGFIVPSIEEFHQRLQQNGIPVHSGPVQPNPAMQFMFILDPNGLKIQLVEYMEPKE